MILICQNRVIHVQVMNWRSLNMFTRIKLTNSWVTWRSYSTLKIICLSTQYIVVRWFKFCLSASFYQHIYRFVAEPFLQEESVVVTTFVSEMGKMVGKTIQVRITFQTKYFEATFFICQKREILGVPTSYCIFIIFWPFLIIFRQFSPLFAPIPFFGFFRSIFLTNFVSILDHFGIILGPIWIIFGSDNLG